MSREIGDPMDMCSLLLMIYIDFYGYGLNIIV